MAVSGAKREKQYVPSDLVRFAFILVLGSWMLFPIFVRDNLAQDATPLVVAGEFLRSDASSIYAVGPDGVYSVSEPFARRTCEIFPAGTDCNQVSVGFVSPPLGLPVAYIMSLLGPTGAIFLYRFVAAGCLAGGMWFLWQRLATRTPRAGPILFVTAALFTPMVMLPVALGQTSPLMFLSIALGISATSKFPRALGAGAVWALATAFKLFPLALVVILLWRRKWRMLGVAAGVLAVLAVVVALMAPSSVFREFIDASKSLAEASMDNRFNGAIDYVARRASPAFADNPLNAVLLIVRLALVGGLGWWIRKSDDDTLWAFAWVALLLFVPLVWWHYLAIAFAAIGVALAGRKQLDDRLLAILPVLAVVTMPITVVNASSNSYVWLQALFLVFAVVAVPVIAKVDLTRRQAFLPD